jgi:hypothetical protein
LTSNNRFSGEPLSVIRHKLDSCKVTVHPPLNPDHETIELPENFLTNSNIRGKVTKEGVELDGADAVYTYEQVCKIELPCESWTTNMKMVSFAPAHFVTISNPNCLVPYQTCSKP